MGFAPSALASAGRRSADFNHGVHRASTQSCRESMPMPPPKKIVFTPYAYGNDKFIRRHRPMQNIVMGCYRAYARPSCLAKYHCSRRSATMASLSTAIWRWNHTYVAMSCTEQLLPTPPAARRSASFRSFDRRPEETGHRVHHYSSSVLYGASHNASHSTIADGDVRS